MCMTGGGGSYECVMSLIEYFLNVSREGYSLYRICDVVLRRAIRILFMHNVLIS